MNKQTSLLDYERVTNCDICGEKSDYLSDYYLMICLNCRHRFDEDYHLYVGHTIAEVIEYYKKLRNKS